jgi:hypothetical protein
VTNDIESFRRERAERRQRELANADPGKHILDADQYDPGHPIRDSHERMALVSAVMLLTHRVGELARVVARISPPPSKNGDGPDA